MAQKILIKKSTVAAKAPTAAQLDVGELAVNTADSVLYTKHSDGSIKLLSPTLAERTKIADSVSSSDSRLTNSREWSAATVTQAEAEAGTASTRRAWTARRVRQAINAWWQLVTSGFGRNFIAAANELAARNVLQLGDAATRNVGESSGNVMEVGAFGLGGRTPSYYDNVEDINFTSTLGGTTSTTGTLPVGVPTFDGWIIDTKVWIDPGFRSQTITRFAMTIVRTMESGVWSSWQELYHTGNILSTTGQSTNYPMTQKAVTDAINARGFADASGVLTATSGALSNDMSSYLSSLTFEQMRTKLSLGTAATSSVVQVAGTSTTDVMSQKAVTDAIAAGGGGGGGSSSLQASVKVTVGASGDFPTINAAVLHLSRFIPDLGVTAEVELLSGFVMSEQLFVEGLDLGWITITGVDAETIINEPSLTRVVGWSARPAFGAISGTLPTIGQLFRFSSKGSVLDSRSGVMAYSIGRACILAGCGVKNAGSYGIYADSGSTITAEGAVASGAGRDCIYAVSGSTINALSADASGAGNNGVHADLGSTIDALFTDASGAGNHGVRAGSGSTINAEMVKASGAGTYGIYVITGSTINAKDATGSLSQAKNTVTSNGIIFQ